jgi:hypothetical protein
MATLNFNEELARRALKAIEANPQEWDQDAWRCKTGMCFAGFVAYAAGATWDSPAKHDLTVRTPNGGTAYVAGFAACELGFYNEDSEGAVRLFSAYNTIEDLQSLIDVRWKGQ